MVCCWWPRTNWQHHIILIKRLILPFPLRLGFEGMDFWRVAPDEVMAKQSESNNSVDGRLEEKAGRKFGYIENLLMMGWDKSLPQEKKELPSSATEIRRGGCNAPTRQPLIVKRWLIQIYEEVSPLWIGTQSPLFFFIFHRTHRTKILIDSHGLLASISYLL